MDHTRLITLKHFTYQEASLKCQKSIGHWIGKALIVFIMITMAWGCSQTPKKTLMRDIATSFGKGEIIDTKTRAAITFEELMREIARVQIIYIGEQHTRGSHHDIHLKLIKEMFKKNPGLLVGMEMFDYSYQAVLEEWSGGGLDQNTFLEKVHWYANWRYNFGLYEDILVLIKTNRIGLVGLNIPRHIPPKIRVGGITYLSKEEKKYLPQEIDTSNAAHRAYLKKVFGHHHFKERVKFEYFYMAQCVWEDAMAESIARHLSDRQMVVLAGNGHIIKNSVFPAGPTVAQMSPFEPFIWYRWAARLSFLLPIISGSPLDGFVKSPISAEASRMCLRCG